MTGKQRKPPAPKLPSLNPDFTQLLMRQPEGGLLKHLHGVQASASDPLPPYRYRTPQTWIPSPYEPEEAPEGEPLVLEATMIQSPTDTNPQGWPSRNAEPTRLSLDTGSIPITEL